MNINTMKLKKGGLDTIIAFIVILLPLVYILIYMVATLYHFSVQMYLNQVVKETLVMASTYGTVTQAMHDNLSKKLEGIMSLEEEDSIVYYVRKFDLVNGDVGERKKIENPEFPIKDLGKADLLGIYVQSDEPSLLATVSNFNILGTELEGDANALRYSAYREEIIRNDDPS